MSKSKHTGGQTRSFYMEPSIRTVPWVITITRQVTAALSAARLFLSTAIKGKGKGKVHPRTGHEGPEGE